MALQLRGKLFVRRGERPVCRLNYTQSPQRTQSQTADRIAGMGLTRRSRSTRSRGAGSLWLQYLSQSLTECVWEVLVPAFGMERHRPTA